MSGMQDQYLALLKTVLTGSVFPESADQPLRRSDKATLKGILKNLILASAAKRGIALVRRTPYDAEAREEGRDCPSIGYTMVGIKRLDNVQRAVETVLSENIPGDIIECGVARGGCAIFMRALLQYHNISDRTVWAADSFEGFPKPDISKYPADEGYDLTYLGDGLSPLDAVRKNFERFKLLDRQVRFLKGWFKDTLPSAPIQNISILRADGDLYESTMDILNNLYDKVSPGGFVIIDDYYAWEPCRKAVIDFRASRGIADPMEKVDWTCVFWRKASA